MSAVSTTPKPTFAQVFKTEVITTPQQSVAFMKKFSKIAVSTILYLRTSFDAEAFKRLKIDGVRVTMLTKKQDNPAAEMILNHISNAMVALQEGHLKEFHLLFVKSDDPDHIVEMHTLKFDVPKKKAGQSGDEVPLTPKDKENALQKALGKLNKKICYVGQDLPDLPDKMELRIRLIFNENTPLGYAPPGYTSATPNTIEKVRFADVPPTPLSYGKLRTSHHKVQAGIQ